MQKKNSYGAHGCFSIHRYDLRLALAQFRQCLMPISKVDILPVIACPPSHWLSRGNRRSLECKRRAAPSLQRPLSPNRLDHTQSISSRPHRQKHRMAMLAATDDDHDVFGLGREMNDLIGRHVRGFLQQFVVVFMPLAARRNLREFQRRMLPEIVFDLLLGDTVPRHDLRVFDAEGDQAACRRRSCRRRDGSRRGAS